MSRGSNAGIARRDDPADDLRAFFAATRRRHGGDAAPAGRRPGRRPAVGTRRGSPATCSRCSTGPSPDAIVVDHLAFSTTLALRAAGRPFTTFVPGHPTQLPVAGEVYGFPTAWPAAVDTVDEAALAAPAAALRGRPRRRSRARYNDALRSLSRRRRAGARRVRRPRRRRALQQPGACCTRRPDGAACPTRHAFLGSCVRAEVARCGDARPWLAARAAGRAVRVRLVRARSCRRATTCCGASSPALPPLGVGRGAGDRERRPRGARSAPAVVARRADPAPGHARSTGPAAVVTHGGNNTVTEALDAGVADGRAAVLDRPVRHRRRPRADRARRRPRSQRGHGRRRGRRRDASIAAPAPSSRGRGARPAACAQRPGPEVAAERLLGPGPPAGWQDHAMRVVSVWRYPVKSMQGEPLDDGVDR